MHCTRHEAPDLRLRATRRGSIIITPTPPPANSFPGLVGGTLVPFSQESFAMECGCSGDSSGTADVGSTPAPASGGNAPAPVPNPSPAGVGCDADSITITSPQLDAFEGCYTDTGGVNSTINSHYGQTSSELGGGTNAVFAAPIDERGHDVSLYIENIPFCMRRWWWWWW